MSGQPRRVVVVGATGLLGGQLVRALWQLGVPLLCVHSGRHAAPGDASAWPGVQWLAADLRAAPPAAFWLAHLQPGDVVVNAAGVLREESASELEAVQHRAPAALFDACAATPVACVVQVSALGADPQAPASFLATKGRADQHLLACRVRGVVVRPSLVWSQGGASARLFAALAVLPLLALPAGGRQAVQPVHIDDVIAGLLALVFAPGPAPGPVIDMVGPQALSLAAYLGALRRALGARRAAAVLPVPPRLFVGAARLAQAMGAQLVSAASARMLLAGNAAPVDGFTALLGRLPRAPTAFVGPGERGALRREALLFWLVPLLRVALAAVWLWTATVSAGLFPIDQSLALLQAVGASAAMAPWLLWGAVGFDLVLGLATLLAPVRWRVRLVWPLQLALMALYTVILSWRLPDFWLHPFGPLSKNLPMAAAIALVWAVDAAGLRRPAPR